MGETETDRQGQRDRETDRRRTRSRRMGETDYSLS